MCTMCTPWPSDWAVYRPDWPGFGMFIELPSVCKGWNPVRVPPRAQCFPRPEAGLTFGRAQNSQISRAAAEQFE
jgi:hypothetical protein